MRITQPVTDDDLGLVDDQTLGYSDYNRDEKQKQTDYENGRIAEVALGRLLDRQGIEYELLGGQGEADLRVGQANVDVKARNCDTGRNLIVNDDQPVNDIIDLYILGIVHRNVDGKPVAVEFVGYIPKSKYEEKKETCEMARNGGYEDYCSKSEVQHYELDAMADFLRFMEQRQQAQTPVTAD